MKIVEMILTETWNVNTCTKNVSEQSILCFIMIE